MRIIKNPFWSDLGAARKLLAVHNDKSCAIGFLCRPRTLHTSNYRGIWVTCLCHIRKKNSSFDDLIHIRQIGCWMDFFRAIHVLRVTWMRSYATVSFMVYCSSYSEFVIAYSARKINKKSHKLYYPCFNSLSTLLMKQENIKCSPSVTNAIFLEQKLPSISLCRKL